MRKVLKWVGIAIGSIVGLVLIAATVLYFVGRSRIGRTYAVSAPITSVPADSASIARGERIMLTRACQECHGDRLQGQVWLDIPPGKIIPPNLTRGRGGVGARYADADWDRAIRYGVRRSGEALLPFMPYNLYNRLTDDDMRALAAYLKAMPAVDNVLPASQLRLPFYIIMGIQNPDKELRARLDEPRAQISEDTTASYGRYVASTACVECHGEQLQGGTGGPGTVAPPLSPTGFWSFEQFATTVRSGVTPTGKQLSRDMPVRFFQHFTDQELRALHEYMKTLARAPT